jgi:FecR-like protein
MSAVVARTPPKRRRGLRLLIVLAVIVLIVGGALFWLNSAAQASVNAAATLTVFRPAVSVARGSGAYAPAATGATVQPGDSVKTDDKGRAAIQLPDGTLTRLASGTELTVSSAHFTKGGQLHDVKLLQKIGRTLSNVQHLVSGASFQVAGQSATASVRGTRFEVIVNKDGSMVVKLFEGQLDFDGKNHVHLVAPQQATADPQGNIGPPGPIQPDPNDPFGPEQLASDAVNVGTTPGTEQDSIGAPLLAGQQQAYTYSYSGGGLVKAALGYTGSLMRLEVDAPDGSKYPKTGPPPIVVVVNNGPPGIYNIIVTGVSGLGTSGEEPFVAVAAVEPCVSSNIAQNGAVRRGYTQQDLVGAVQVSGLANLSLTLTGSSLSGAIVNASGTYNGVGWTGSVVIVAHGGVLQITALGATIFGLNVPAQQVAQQIASVIGQDPSNLNPGFIVDRLFTCDGVLMIDGRAG